MRKTSVTQFDFGSGELSPQSLGRTDKPEYSSGVAYSKDFIPSSEGPISNRPGTERYAEASSAGPSRLIPFSPRNDTGFLLELFDQGLNVREPVPGFNGVERISATGSYESPLAGNVFGDYYLYSETGTHKYYRKLILDISPDVYGSFFYEIGYIKSTGLFEYVTAKYRDPAPSEGAPLPTLNDVILLYYDAGDWKNSGAPNPIEDFSTTITTSSRSLDSSSLTLYSEDDLVDVRYTSSGDVLYLTHPNYPPAILYPNGDDTWTIEPAPLTTGPFVEPTEDQADIQLSIDDFDYRASIFAQGADFSTHLLGDYLAYKDGNDWVLATFVSTDGDNEHAIVKPVKSIASGLDPSARIEYQATSTLSFLGAVSSPTVSADKSIFSGGLRGAWLRFSDITSSGDGQVTSWVKLVNYLGVDTAGSGFFYHGGTNPAEVDVFLTETVKTGITEYSNLQGIRTTDSSGNELNTTNLRSSSDLFEYTRDEGRVVQIQIQDTVLNCTVIADAGNTATKALVSVDYALPYNSDATVQSSGRASSWRIGAFYTGNYPAACGIFNQRFVYAGTPSHPETIWNSRIGRYYDFSPRERDGSVLATTSFSFALAGQKFAPIRWLLPGTELLVGTEGAFWTTGPRDSVYASGSFYLEKHDDLGSTIPPIRVGSVLLLVQYSGRQIFEIEYSDDQKTYRADDGTTVPNHLFRENRIVDIQLQRTPNPLLWILLDDGELVTLTPRWRGNRRSYGLSRQGLGTVATLAPLYDPSSSRDVLFILTDRGGSSFIERMTFDYLPQNDNDRSGMIYTDSSLLLETEGSAVSYWAFLDDYVGESVTILLDGEVWKRDYTLEQSYITGVPPASKITIGYRYEPTLKLLPMSNTSTAGNIGTQGRLRHIQGIIAQLHRSWGIRHGPRIDGTLLQPGSMVEENFENHDDVPKNVTLMTGSMRLSSSHRSQRDTEIWIQQTQPYPLNILSITVEGEVE